MKNGLFYRTRAELTYFHFCRQIAGNETISAGNLKLFETIWNQLISDQVGVVGFTNQ